MELRVTLRNVNNCQSLVSCRILVRCVGLTHLEQSNHLVLRLIEPFLSIGKGDHLAKCFGMSPVRRYSLNDTLRISLCVTGIRGTKGTLVAHGQDVRVQGLN